MKNSPKTLQDLRPSKYNPRTITTQQLRQLGDSYTKFGDLSGVVVNVNAGRNILISGHQRLKTLKNKKTRIVKNPCTKDIHGTVAVGFIEVINKTGKISIPYREVDWPDKQMEMAANITANSGGGEFDNVKLGSILEELKKGKFAIEEIAMDSFELQKALIEFRKSKMEESGTDTSEEQEKSGKKGEKSFDKVDPRGEKFEHKCPRCKFQW